MQIPGAAPDRMGPLVEVCILLEHSKHHLAVIRQDDWAVLQCMLKSLKYSALLHGNDDR